MHPARYHSRRAGVKAPCDECIARASRKSGKAVSLKLCDTCISILRPFAPATLAGRGVPRARQKLRAIAAKPSTQIPAAITIPWSQDRQEQHALDFFTRTSAPQFAGFFDASFWQHTVLQAARREPAIKHALAAVGAIHERVLSSGEAEPIAPDVRDPRMQFALEQCNSAIHELTTQRERTRQPNLRLILTACLLLVSFEGLQGKPQEAMAHIMQGYNLACMHGAEVKRTRSDSEESAVDLEFLTVHFTRLASQAKGIMQKELPLIPRPLSATDSAPTNFETLQEARAAIELLFLHLRVYITDLDIEEDNFYDMAIATADKQLKFRPWIEHWKTAFAKYLDARRQGMSDADKRSVMVLTAYKLMAEVLIGHDISQRQLGWDMFIDKFGQIIDIAETLLDGEKPHPASFVTVDPSLHGMPDMQPTRIVLSFGLGIIDAIWETILRCRDPLIRRRGLSLLARHPRQEGLAMSWSTWKAGMTVVHLEEGVVGRPVLRADDIPEECRLALFGLSFSDTSTEETARGVLNYIRSSATQAPRWVRHPRLYERDMRNDAAITETPAVPNRPSQKNAHELGDSAGMAWQDVVVTPNIPPQ